MSMLFLNIATVPDFSLGAKLYELHDLSDKDIARVMWTKNREKTGSSERLSRHLLKLAGLSALILDEQGVRLASTIETNEQDQLKFLSALIEQHNPELVTWDASAVLSVLNYRYFAHAMPIPLAGDAAVVDLMTELSEYDGGSVESKLMLNEVSVLAGLPHVTPASDDVVLNAFLKGDHDIIRGQLELGVINTCLIYQKWLMVCGDIATQDYEWSLSLIKAHLLKLNQSHLTTHIEQLNTT